MTAEKVHCDHFPTGPEPIAVIGMGCRFSGKASSIQGFWDTLRLGRQEHSRVPPNRYQGSAWEHPSYDRKGADPGYFDAPFFSITAKEAAGMDPAQRLLLEVAYEAFENGGIPIESLPGSATGVYSGCMTNDYEMLSARDLLDMPHNSATGNARTMLANRISWFFDLRGPSVMMDTACSSSLTALHVAVQALRAGECNQRMSYMHMLSADGMSHAFDSRANGYGRGEGAGAVLLKPLSQALADGNAIRALIRATGSNHVGRTPGITMPNADAQADLIRATYRQAHLAMHDTVYFEAHGTGTPVGDPAELSAIGASLGAERQPSHEPVYVGSVKSNIGHTEGAAGLASLIKTILCLEKGILVPQTGFSQLNPKIRLAEWGLRLCDATTATPWPAHLPQRASMNSFGFGGANAHAILESAVQYLGPAATPQAPDAAISGNRVPHGRPKGLVSDTKRTMPHERESPCFLHPTSLDALFQAAVISRSEALTNNNANIPVAVDRLYLSTGLSWSPGTHFEVYSETREENGNLRSESFASDPSWQQPAVVMQGVRLGPVPVRAKPPGTGTTSPSSRFSSLQWGVHLDSIHVSSDGQAAHCPGGLQGWVKRLCHTYGNAATLVVMAANNNKNISQVIEALHVVAPRSSQRPSLQQLTVVLVQPGPNQAGASGESLQEALPGCQVLSIDAFPNLDLDLLGETAFDAIILDHPESWAPEGKTSQAIFNLLDPLTGPNTWIAARAPADQLDSATLFDSLQGTDWQARGAIDQTDYRLIRRRTPACELDPVVYILAAAPTDIPNGVLHELQDVFMARDTTIELVNLHETPDLTGKTVVSLLELTRPWISGWEEREIEQLRSLLEAKCLLWVSQSSEHEASGHAAAGATTGLLRTLRQEKSSIALPQLLVSEDEHKNAATLARSIDQVLQLTLQPNSSSRPRDWEFTAQDGCLLVPRAISDGPLDETMEALLNRPRPALAELAHDQRPLRLRAGPSELTKAYWEEDEYFKTALADDQVEIQLHQVSISEPGSKKGLCPEARVSALEAIGTVRHVGRSLGSTFIPGDSVVCVIPSKTWYGDISTRVRLPATAVWNRPPGQEPMQSVSMPVAYTAAYTSLFHSSGLTPASVLIVGSISQTFCATVECALAAGIRVYAAVDSEPTVGQLAAKYPRWMNHLTAIHRDLSTTICRWTHGKGVETVVCCHGGGALGRLAAHCLANNGRLVDLSGELNLSALPQTLVDRGCTVSSVQLSHRLRDAPHQMQAYFHRAVDLLAGQRDGLARVEAYPVFPVSQLTKAQAHARDAGARVIVDLQTAGEHVPIVPALPESANLPADNSYLLVGGLGTLGLALARTLVDCGARHLVFVSRSGVVQQQAQQFMIDHLQECGVRVDTVRCDVASREDLEKLLAWAKEHQWRIRGVVQCATVLKDAMFDQMTPEQWHQSTAPKIRGTWNLHEAFCASPADSASLAPLDFFVTLSSVASVIGNMGQANYSAGNGYMDALMRWRRRHGLAGCSINVGLVPDASGVGDVIESPEARRHRYRHLEGTEILQHELQTLLRAVVQGLAPVPAQIIAGMTDVLPRASGTSSPWQFDRKFDHRVRREIGDAAAGGGAAAGALKTSLLLKKAETRDEAVRLVQQALQQYLAHAMMAASADDIDLELPFSALGVDSLKAAEVQNWVSRELGAELSSFEFLGSQPVRVLAEKIAAESSFALAAAPA
ncbi:ketoacyl-synt-domain-containing protein [Aspergillus violaceofuscus CBS 115571]|uniref:Ketoacyl-synt-domain-containing protein n=1 Tax=Aspergillus violaceofuscus (strain CBS 115571) TaxID=1450538 RepID=A0A2V5HI96_ASPV1|nr:ketoacyl-synt-domain-containing protein [Aspergillus violaceofuscus CBS 115571]